MNNFDGLNNQTENSLSSIWSLRQMKNNFHFGPTQERLKFIPVVSRRGQITHVDVRGKGTRSSA